jgi:hypothetical protein
MGTGPIQATSSRAVGGLMHNTSKGRKMNWFKRMVVKWVRDDWENAGRRPPEQDCYPTTKNSISGSRDISSDPTLQFKVYNAIGGKIVEFSRYDRQTDRTHHQIYIIGKDEDFGEKIAKISTFEVLKS